MKEEEAGEDTQRERDKRGRQRLGMINLRNEIAEELLSAAQAAIDGTVTDRLPPHLRYIWSESALPSRIAFPSQFH